jgi:hypothetical protein
MTNGWPRWTRGWQVRVLALATVAILVTWLTLAVLAYLWNRDRIIGAPN